jgi:hypothetical protein
MPKKLGYSYEQCNNKNAARAKALSKIPISYSAHRATKQQGQQTHVQTEPYFANVHVCFNLANPPLSQASESKDCQIYDILRGQANGENDPLESSSAIKGTIRKQLECS